MALLAVRLLHLLREFGEVTFEDLAEELATEGYSAADTERALFDQSELFDHDGGTPRRWHIIEGAGSPPSKVFRGPPLRDWQRDALQEWIASGRQGVVEAVTGTGKTSVGVAAIADAYSRGLRSLILVPGIDLMDQWHEVLRRQLPEARVGRLGSGHKDVFGRNRILIATVQSASRAADVGAPSHYLLVADEVHRYGAASFSRALSARFSERLGLTATYERNDDAIDLILTPYFKSVIDGCDYARAHSDGIIAPVRVALVAVKFTPDEQSAYSDADERAKDSRSKLIQYGGVSAEPFGQFMQEVQELAGREGGERETFLARKYLKAFGDRRSVLAQSDAKMRLLKDIAPVLQGPCRSILFSETVSAAQESSDVLVKAGVAAEAMTSGLSPAERADVMERFRSGETAALATPRLLDEGIDVPEAEVGVILAASRSRRQMIQRMGRIIRPKHDGRHATFVIAYVKGTAEDPDNGAHLTFLDQIEDIAEVVERLSAEDCADLLGSWLSLPAAPDEVDQPAAVEEVADLSDRDTDEPQDDGLEVGEGAGEKDADDDWIPPAVLDIADELQGVFVWDELTELLPEPEVATALRERDFDRKLTWTLVGSAVVGAGGNDPVSQGIRRDQLWSLADLWRRLGPDVTPRDLLDAYRATPLKTLTIDRMCFLWEALDDAMAGSAGSEEASPPAPAVRAVSADRAPTATPQVPAQQSREPGENAQTLSRGLEALTAEIARRGGSSKRLEGTRRTALTVTGRDGSVRIARVRTRSGGDWQGTKKDADLSLDDTGSVCWVFVDVSVAPAEFYLLTAQDAAAGVQREVDEWLAADPSRRVEDQDHHAYRLAAVEHGRDKWRLLGLADPPPHISKSGPRPAAPATRPKPVARPRVPARMQGQDQALRLRVYFDCDGFRTFAAYDTATNSVMVTKSSACPILVGRNYPSPSAAAKDLNRYIAGDGEDVDGMLVWIIDDGSRRNLRAVTSGAR